VRIAVLGATGTLGRHVADVATERGHDVVACSRSSGQDVTTGEGLDAAFDGAAAVIDAANVMTWRRSVALGFFDASAKHVQSAARTAGVAHVCVVSIVGIDRLRSLGYYDAKLTHERRHLDGDVPSSVVRATQFHEFAGQVLSLATVGPLGAVPSLRVQTVAARSVAALLVDAVEAGPARGRLPDVAGPGPVRELPALARALLAARGSRTRVLALRVPGAAGRAVRDGALLPAHDARLVGPTFEAWLDATGGTPSAPGGAARG
jgi:uncharacterized protein YbjT (DUF2867 family)